MSTEDTIPKARFDEVIAARRAAEDRNRDLEAKIRTLEGSEARVTALEAEVTRFRAAESAWSDERAILVAGITDPDGVDFARHAWSRLPANARPSGGLGAWLASREALPKAVQAYLPATQVQAGTTQVQAGTTQVQAGTAQVQAGTTQVQAGTTQVQAGTAQVQAGAGHVPAAQTGAATSNPAHTPDQLRALAIEVAAGRQPKTAWDAAMAALNGSRRVT